MADRLWNDKQKFKQQGGCAYRFYKMKANSFIGCFAQRKRTTKHFTMWDDVNPRDEKPNNETISRYDIFGIITAMARRTLTKYMDMAKEAGCTIYQCNTDGFITDKPIPNFESSAELGGLRLDKELDNLYIFSPNQYVADGIQCISGLPSGMYKRGTTKYTFSQIKYSPISRKFNIINTTVDLLKTIREFYFLTEEDIINGGYY